MKKDNDERRYQVDRWRRPKEDLAAFRSAWQRADHGETVQPERVLAFESWEGLASVMTGER